MSSESSSNFSIGELFRILLRRWFVFLASFTLLLALAVLLVLVRRDTFVSEAKLFVRIGRESVALDPTATTGQTFSLHASRETEINSIIVMFRSRGIVEQVVDAIGPEKILDADENFEWVAQAKQWMREVCSSTVGATLGSIIAAIITHHISSTSRV